MINLASFLKKHSKAASILSLLATLAVVAGNIETIINASQKVFHLFKEDVDIVAIKKDLSSDDIALHIDAANQIEKYGTTSVRLKTIPCLWNPYLMPHSEILIVSPT